MWLPDISEDYQISQLSSPTDYQKCWSYFYPCSSTYANMIANINAISESMKD